MSLDLKPETAIKLQMARRHYLTSQIARMSRELSRLEAELLQMGAIKRRSRYGALGTRVRGRETRGRRP